MKEKCFRHRRTANRRTNSGRTKRMQFAGKSLWKRKNVIGEAATGRVGSLGISKSFVERKKDMEALQKKIAKAGCGVPG